MTRLPDTWIDVAIPLPLYQTFHYKLPPDLINHVTLGSRVLVPFKNRKLLGFVVGFPKEGFPKAKPILEACPESFFSKEKFDLLQWISNHYAAPIGEVIKATVPLLKSKNPKKPKPFLFPKLSYTRPTALNEDQKKVLALLVQALNKKEFSPFLLHGVTGSGKTEIYLSIIEHAIQKQKTAIVLVPEISLTPQLLFRFQTVFPNQIAVLHSGLSQNQRHYEWTKIQAGKALIVLGARSAIFAPLQNLGVIVVDEEHDTSFKQEEKIRYHARNIALVRGQIDGALVILGSATPSLESMFNVTQKKLTYLSLPNRVQNRPLPKIELIPLNQNKTILEPPQIFSKPLLNALQETLHKKEQAILLLNRRGYAPVLLCQSCGYVPKCPHCNVGLTVYLKTNRLLCHYCNQSQSIPKTCKDCEHETLLTLGIGTERVEAELHTLFPDARIDRMDRSSTRKKNSLHRLLKDFSDQKTDILIGTQMLAKGHDFPNVTLVGVVLADTSLNFPDFRAPEQTFQLLTQVAGRSGRGQKPGRVIIQTFHPDHYCFKYAQNHDFLGFYKEELTYRQMANYPPYIKLFNFKIRHPNLLKAKTKIESLAKKIQKIRSQDPQIAVLEVLGPAPAPFSKLQGQYRFHLLVKSPSYALGQRLLKNLLQEEAFFTSSPKIHIDVDPLNLL
ncbi:MAG: primosomal protein N' [Deltaproteobacteria bacterium RIFCSPHIGHO2_02_FULL_40_11]|nr:MAG: primosomal protein N' [Deltaproteobacteria bacterium RIFCSPHIGHO2_02_FULL_40_11]